MKKKPVGTINSAILKIEEDSEKMLPAAQTGGRQTRDAPWDRAHSQGRVTAIRLLWAIEHGFH
jgi:hypothetical protein